MILPGERYDQFFQVIWGKYWKVIGARRLGITRQALYNRCQSKTGLSRQIKRELLAITEEQIALLSQIAIVLREDVGA